MSKSTSVDPLSDNDDLYRRSLEFAYGVSDPAELESTDAPPPPRSKPEPVQFWSPDLNPTQQNIFDDPALNVLGYGEKGSGKSIGFGHKLVRHAYENDNALILVIAPSMRTGNEGIWFDLETLILPQWGEGIGLKYTNSKLDPNTKDRHRWIKNRFGGWSKLLLMSIPYAAQVQNRVKGPAPSMVYIDELTNCDGLEYYTFTAAQLGRRRGISGPQQFCASCNPDGPSHWVYKLFWESNGDNPNYTKHHVPILENKARLPEGYVERLIEVLRTDPVEYARLIKGEWVDRPTGDGLFKEYYIPAIHLKGNPATGTGLMPLTGFPIVIGYDLGQVFSSVTLLQLIPTKTKTLWIIFDEIDHLGQKILYKKLAWEVIEKMRFWQLRMDYKFNFRHITDESAINQWRPGNGGSFDAWEFEKEYNRELETLGGSDMRPIKLEGCEKGPGSVAARVRLLQGKLFQEEVFVSARCPNAIETLMKLEADKEDPEKPKRSKYLHKFDSMTYPMLKMEMGGSKSLLKKARVPTIIRVGGGQVQARS